MNYKNRKGVDRASELSRIGSPLAEVTPAVRRLYGGFPARAVPGELSATHRRSALIALTPQPVPIEKASRHRQRERSPP